MGTALPCCTELVPPFDDLRNVEPRSAFAFTAGEIVEECLCLPVDVADILGTVLDGCCFNVLDASDPDLRLVPLGLGLLYRHASEPTLRTECSIRDGRYWLTLRAVRALAAHESLTVSWDSHCPPESMPIENVDDWRTLGCLSWNEIIDTNVQRSRLKTGPHGIPNPLDPRARRRSVKISHSHVQGAGLGCFAERNLMAHELVDIVPVFPLVQMVDFLDGYPFSHEDWFDRHSDTLYLRFMCLGPAMIYNHGKEDANLTHLFTPSESLMFQAWFTTRDVEEGEELLYDYGDEYAAAIAESDFDVASNEQN